MKFFSVAWFVFLALTLSWSPNADSASSELEKQIETIISMRHPPSDEAQWWRSLGPDAPPVIQAMYREESGTYRRQRLLQGLAWYGDEASQAFLREEADRQENSMVKRSAIRALARSDAPGNLEFLEKFLDHHDGQIRYATARALQRWHSVASVREVLDRHRRGEKVEWVKKKLARPLNTASKVAAQVNPSLGQSSHLGGALHRKFFGEWEGLALFPHKGQWFHRPLRLLIGKGFRGQYQYGSLEKPKRIAMKGHWEARPSEGPHLEGLIRVEAQSSAIKGPLETRLKEYKFKARWGWRGGQSTITVNFPKLGELWVLSPVPSSSPKK